jgi:hypothetical protein
MDKDTTYNGWTNYETWRVNLEMFDADFSSDNEMDAYDLGQSMREMALEIVGQHGSGITLDYAEAFLSAVNWYEIGSMNIDAYRPPEEFHCRNGIPIDDCVCC